MALDEDSPYDNAGLNADEAEKVNDEHADMDKDMDEDLDDLRMSYDDVIGTNDDEIEPRRVWLGGYQ